MAARLKRRPQVGLNSFREPPSRFSSIEAGPTPELMRCGSPGSKPGARTERRSGRGKASPERILLLRRSWARVSRSCPRLLFLDLFLRLLGDAAFCDLGARLACCTDRERLGLVGWHPGRICVADDCLGGRAIPGQSGIRDDARLHQPIEHEEKACVG